MTKWLNARGVSVRLNCVVLADDGYYAFVSDGFNQLCSAASVLPCMLDAAIFAEMDGQGWTPDYVTD